MAKLTIGKTQSTIKKKEAIKDPFNDLTDEQLSDMIDEIENIDNDEKTEETGIKIDGASVKIDEIREIDDFNFDKNIIEAFKETYPRKRILYRNKITNQFVDFYIENSHSGKQLTDINIELLTEKQKEKFLAEISEIDMVSAVKEVNEKLNKEYEEANERINKKNEEIFDGYIISGDEIIIDPTKEQAKKYELILSKQWDSREKGIIELDDIIREIIIKKEEKSLTTILNYLLEQFKINSNNINNIKEKKEKKEKRYIKPNELSKAIIYFHHIEFLFGLLDDESLFERKRDFTEEETEEIKKIISLMNGGKETNES